MENVTLTNWKYLAANPKSSYKQLYVRGTRIPARALYGWYVGPEPFSPDFIAEQFNLPVEAVLESIAYCESNPAELLEDYARDEALMEASGMNAPDYRLNPRPKPLSPEEMARIRRS